MELKFDDTEEEKYIVSYLLKDQLFFLKVSKYLATRDWPSKQYFQDAKLQFIWGNITTFRKKNGTKWKKTDFFIFFSKKMAIFAPIKAWQNAK